MGELNHDHFHAALGQIRPSVSSGDAEAYDRVHARIRGTDST
jgi:ribosome biogenesis ATPase|tara:strand:+ start:272 stop:397 length:126 start_codon:yes stop_codon:yes gene_type:complete